MKKLIFITIALTILSGCGGKKPVPASRLQQSAGQFSYVTPEGWYRTKLAGIDYVIVSTDTDFGIRPNIFVDYIQSSAMVSNIVEKVVKTNTDNYRAYKVSQQSDFMTDSALAGIKITASRTNKDALPLTTFHYVIQDSGRVIVITCTCATPVMQKYEPVFDTAMRSLKTKTTN